MELNFVNTIQQGGGIKQSLIGVNKVEQGIKQSLMGGIKQSLPNNIVINNINNNNKERKKETSYDSIINNKINDNELKDLLYEFIKMRKMKKKPLTDRALTIQINKLFKLSPDIEEQKKIVENSIVKCWDEFYELKKENNYGNERTTKSDGSEYAMFS